MPIKGFFQNNEIDEIQHKLRLLEQQYKKVNTIEVYMKHFMKIEKHFELMKLNEKRNKESVKGNVRSSKSEEELKKEIERNILVKVERVIKVETGRMKQKFEEINKKCSELEKKFLLLEHQYKENKKEIQSLRQELTKNVELENTITDNRNPVIFQEINIDKLFVDKYEQNNNLGQLGINQLSGQLTIGAAYDKGVIPTEIAEKWKENMNKSNKTKDDENKKENGEDHDETFQEINLNDEL